MSFISEFFKGIAQFTSMGAGIFVLDSILGFYSIPGIDFPPLNPAKNIATGKYTLLPFL
jgi:hypothetical protein